ncbi:MAG: hypothetical protein WCC26_08730 [Terracidiphilus sp.]
MLMVSATQAIAPAVERTRNLLFRPFRWGTFLKLCAVAVFTEGFSGNFNFSHGSHASHTHIDPGTIPFHITPALMTALAFVGIAVVVLVIAIFYLAVRLRFALFECLVHQDRRIAPGWHKYRFQALRFFLLSIAVGLVFLVIVAALMLPFFIGFLRLFREMQISGHFPLAAALGLILPLIPLFLGIIVAGFAVDLILRDFMLPHMALENASAGQAWNAVRTRIVREMGSFFLYAVLRILLPLAALIALFIALALPGILLFGLLGVSMAAIHAALHNASMALTVIGSVFEVLLGLLIMALALFLAIAFGGPLCMSIRNYALVFYGGRYQALGDILYPPPPAPPPA